MFSSAGWLVRSETKATINWPGPRRIVSTLSDWVLRVEDLRNGSETTHHVSRLKLFAGADMGVTQPLLDHIAYVEGGHLVEELLDYRYSRARKTWEIEVKWLGLQEIDNSWEPCDALLQDVPVLVREFIARGIKTSKNVAKMAIAYSLLPSSSDA
jgi:hypothetical protein